MGSRGPVAGDPSKLAGHRRAPGGVTLEPPAPDAKPRRLPHAGRYSAATRRWWRTWATSPQSSQFLETDWMRLEMIADIVEAFVAESDPVRSARILAKIRVLEAPFGCTVANRLRLRWRLAPAEPPEQSGPEPTRRRSRSKADPRLRLVGDAGE